MVIGNQAAIYIYYYYISIYSCVHAPTTAPSSPVSLSLLARFPQLYLTFLFLSILLSHCAFLVCLPLLNVVFFILLFSFDDWKMVEIFEDGYLVEVRSAGCIVWSGRGKKKRLDDVTFCFSTRKSTAVWYFPTLVLYNHLDRTAVDLLSDLLFFLFVSGKYSSLTWLLIAEIKNEKETMADPLSVLTCACLEHLAVTKPGLLEDDPFQSRRQ